VGIFLNLVAISTISMCGISIILLNFQRFFEMEENDLAELIYQTVYSLNSNLDNSGSTTLQNFLKGRYLYETYH